MFLIHPQQAEEDNEQRKRQEQILMEKLLEQEAMMEENQKVRVLAAVRLSGSGGDGGLSRLFAFRLIIQTHGRISWCPSTPPHPTTPQPSAESHHIHSESTLHPL